MAPGSGPLPRTLGHLFLPQQVGSPPGARPCAGGGWSGQPLNPSSFRTHLPWGQDSAPKGVWLQGAGGGGGRGGGGAGSAIGLDPRCHGSRGRRVLARFLGGSAWTRPVGSPLPAPEQPVDLGSSGRVPGTAPALIKIDFSEGLGTVPAAAGAPGEGGQVCSLGSTVGSGSWVQCHRARWDLSPCTDEDAVWGGRSSLPGAPLSQRARVRMSRVSGAQQNSPALVLLFPWAKPLEPSELLFY